jgi:hypothetical protein
MRPDLRLPALRRFAVAITILNLLGHTVLGFEQSWTQLWAPVATAYATEAMLELIAAWSSRRPSVFAGDRIAIVDFFLPAHITGLAVSMLLYANDRVAPVVFAAGCGVASKVLFRVDARGSSRHVMNPSNFGIAVTLLAFPSVGIAPPYAFTENLTGAWDWLLPGIICITGTLLNLRFTGKLPLIAAWMGGFALQAVVRSLVTGAAVVAALAPMTGMAFLLFSFYMVSDPATTPFARPRQVWFGLAVAAAYAALQLLHVVFGLFFSLALVCLGRGLGLWWMARRRARAAAVAAGAPVPGKPWGEAA